ncbi:MAG: F0F1 ATP synthase subunit epsilon [Bacteroidia bacterium]|nr:F0F1 ATP synthase subunit epsilon [Bacteroidia bacterium]
MDKLFDVELVTPQRVEFTGKAVSVSCPGIEGRFQVLYNHAPFLSALTVGLLNLERAGETALVYAVSGGVVQVFHNHVRILADTAERSDSIDVVRATKAKERAEARLKSHAQDMDSARAEAALHRALNRLKAAGRA